MHQIRHSPISLPSLSLEYATCPESPSSITSTIEHLCLLVCEVTMETFVIYICMLIVESCSAHLLYVRLLVGLLIRLGYNSFQNEASVTRIGALTIP